METINKTILTIDDEESVRKSFKRYLEDLDYVVFEASNGKTGLDIFLEKNPDLVLIDLRMPEVDGFDVITRIKEKSPDTPLIVISGAGNINDVVESIHKGAWDYLMKPINDISILKHTIDKAFERAFLIKENRDYQEHLEELVSLKTESLKKLLKEKEILLKELHHRVKNNLNLILSLFELSGKHKENEEFNEYFMKIQNRIYSIALIHKLLYKSQEISKINFERYVNDLIINLKKSLDIKNINFNVTAEEHEIDLDKIKTLGIILNELITNSIKHAFPGDKEGIININFKKTDLVYELTIEDNGIGIKNYKDENELSGLTLVKYLIEDINGNLQISNNDGVKIKLVFK